MYIETIEDQIIYEIKRYKSFEIFWNSINADNQNKYMVYLKERYKDMLNFVLEGFNSETEKDIREKQIEEWLK